jgi:hypothetical protein
MKLKDALVFSARLHDSLTWHAGSRHNQTPRLRMPQKSTYFHVANKQLDNIFFCTVSTGPNPSEAWP